MDFFLSLAKITAAAFAGFLLLLYLRQENMIFLGAKLPENLVDELRRSFPGSEISLNAPDGVRLHGWHLRSDSSSPAPLLIFFGGNAEDVSAMLLEHRRFRDMSLLLINYRGYGLSKGKPTQKALVEDATFLYDRFTALPEVDAGRILVMGRSLGTGVAVELAARRKVQRLILISPFESLRSLARHHYPWLPAGLLLRHPFDSIKHAPAMKTPVLTLIAGEDRIVPPRQSHDLMAAWSGETQIAEFPGADHNDLEMQPGFWPAIQDYLDDGRNHRQEVHP